jgi:L-ascorbate metabolism protein UlaG (beta-lactamase superfamily)
MVINYFGEGCFRLQSGETSLLVNPINNRLKADVVLKTLTLPNIPPPVGTEISFPGEYEIKGIEIRGRAVEKESTEKFLKTIYAVNWEEIRFLFLGHLSKYPEAELIEAMGEPEVVFVPAGDSHFIDSADAVKLIKHLEPAVVIPGFYKNPEEFLKAIGQKAPAEEKFVFKKKDLADKKKQVIVLEPRS